MDNNQIKEIIKYLEEGEKFVKPLLRELQRDDLKEHELLRYNHLLSALIGPDELYESISEDNKDEITYLELEDFIQREMESDPVSKNVLLDILNRTELSRDEEEFSYHLGIIRIYNDGIYGCRAISKLDHDTLDAMLDKYKYQDNKDTTTFSVREATNDEINNIFNKLTLYEIHDVHDEAMEEVMVKCLMFYDANNDDSEFKNLYVANGRFMIAEEK